MSNISIFIPHQGCPQNCSFCNQKIISGETKRVTAEDVKSTLDTALRSLGDKSVNSQIAFFGGSFTAIDRDYMLELLEATATYREHFAGIRVSTRPDAIDTQVLQVLKSYGVVAIELGAQSMSDGVLALNDRGHTAESVRVASKLIKDAGFQLGVQMMTGLYGSSDELDIYTARELVKLNPDTVRIYPTVVLKGTRLDSLVKEGKYTPQTVDSAVNLCVELLPIFEQAGVEVIRVGLHASQDIEKNYTGGAYHQAFKELCLSRIYLSKISDKLFQLPKGDYTVLVPPSAISQAVGQHKANLTWFEQRGYTLSIKPDEGLHKYEVRI